MGSSFTAAGFPLIYVGDYLNPARSNAPMPAGQFRVHRRAVRAVVLDDRGAIHLGHATKKGFYKLLGGGIHESETLEAALARELQEEAGYAATILHPIGRTIQYDAEQSFYQESYAFLARITSRGPAGLTPAEAAAGFEVAKFASIPAAIQAVLNSIPATGERLSGLGMLYRDAAILEAAISPRQA